MKRPGRLWIPLVTAPMLLLGGLAYLYFTSFCFEENRYLAESDFCSKLKSNLAGEGKPIKAAAISQCYLKYTGMGPYVNVWFGKSKIFENPELSGDFSESRYYLFTSCGSFR